MSYRLSLPARYQECIARLPNARILAREDNPWIIPNFLFIAASFGFTFATSTFFDHPTSSPMLLSLSTLCLCFISWRTRMERTEEMELNCFIVIYWDIGSSKQVKLGWTERSVRLSSIWSTVVGVWDGGIFLWIWSITFYLLLNNDFLAQECNVVREIWITITTLINNKTRLNKAIEKALTLDSKIVSKKAYNHVDHKFDDWLIYGSSFNVVCPISLSLHLGVS